MSDVMLDPAWPDPPPEGFRHDAGDPDEAFPVPFSAFDALAMVIWTIVAQVIVVGIAIGMGVLSGDPDVDPIATTGLTVQIVAQVLTLLGMVVYLRGRGVLSWRILGPIRPRWSHVGIGMGLGVGGLILVLTLAEMTNRAFGPFDAPEQYALEVANTSALVMVLAVVSAVLLAPIVEEVVFRSLLFQSVRRKLGLVAAMVISSLVFAYIHLEVVGNPPAVVGLVALALWLAGAFHRSGSLVVPITAHATYNLVVLGLQAAIETSS